MNDERILLALRRKAKELSMEDFVAWNVQCMFAGSDMQAWYTKLFCAKIAKDYTKVYRALIHGNN